MWDKARKHHGMAPTMFYRLGSTIQIHTLFRWQICCPLFSFIQPHSGKAMQTELSSSGHIRIGKKQRKKEGWGEHLKNCATQMNRDRSVAFMCDCSPNKRTKNTISSLTCRKQPLAEGHAVPFIFFSAFAELRKKMSTENMFCIF
ncbi:hypothetical protein XELAEV_18002842mg [Xenopus laevis]|nr:hypothetical protein XELAEV_18002842mg [Xenopus laevis]